MGRNLLIAAATMIILVGLAALLDVGPFRSFEDRLKAAVSLPDCEEVQSSHHGFYGNRYEVLRRGTQGISQFSCEFGGPLVAWYRFDDKPAFAAAVDSFRPDRQDQVCRIVARHEIILAGEVKQFRALCRARGGTVSY